MSKTIPTGEITGKVNANPNPIPFGQGEVEISWETNDPAGAELRVCLSSGEERLVRRGDSGTVEIPWIKHSAEYYFRVYGASQPDVPLDTVKVQRESSGNILSELTREVSHGNVDPFELSQFIAKVWLSACTVQSFPRSFGFGSDMAFTSRQ